MTHRSISATLLFLCAVTPAYGADLQFSVNGAVEYDDNVFRREDNKKDDVLFRLRPGVRVFEDRGDDLNFSVGYAIPLEFAADNNEELRDEDHIADGKFTYHVNDRIEIFGSDHFGYLRSTLRRERIGTESATAGASIPTLADERERVTRNDAQLGMSYSFSPRTVARIVASSDFFDPTRDDRSRVYSVGGNADLTYRLSLRHQVGGGAGYTFQEFDDREAFAGSQSDIYRIFASWRWTIDETLSLDVRAGPSYLRQDQNSAPAVRTRQTVGFTVLPAQQVNGFFDRNGAPFSGPVGPGSLLVPSFLASGGSGTTVNCATVNGVVVALNCRPNIVLDSTDPTDQQVIAAILGSTTPLTNVNPAGDSSSNLTVFAEATIAKRWTPNLSTALRYHRRQGNASGLGGTVVVDAVSLSNTWDFLERWSLSLRGDWTYRQNAFDTERTLDRAFPVGNTELGLPPGTVISLAGVCDPSTGCTAGSSFNTDTRADIDSQRWSVAGRITHKLFRHTLLYVQVRYDDQDSESRTLGRSSDFENLLATFGVRHVFEPIKLW